MSASLNGIGCLCKTRGVTVDAQGIFEVHGNPMTMAEVGGDDKTLVSAANDGTSMYTAHNSGRLQLGGPSGA